MKQYTKAYIQLLLNKFMDGTTTLDEEDVLHDYFTHGKVPAEWALYEQLFAEIESMRPVSRPKWQWKRWSIAAVVAFAMIVLASTQWLHNGREKTEVIASVAKTATEIAQSSTNTSIEIPTNKSSQSIPTSRKRQQHRTMPTLADNDESMAQLDLAEEERKQAENEIERVQQEILHSQLIAAGYVAFKQEDGTILYTNDPKIFLTNED